MTNNQTKPAVIETKGIPSETDFSGLPVCKQAIIDHPQHGRILIRGYDDGWGIGSGSNAYTLLATDTFASLHAQREPSDPVLGHLLDPSCPYDDMVLGLDARRPAINLDVPAIALACGLK